MKTETVYTTSDGQRHDTIDRAKRHADARYADAMCRLSHRLVAVEKYGRMTEFVDAHLDEFVALKALRDDANTLVDEDGDTRTWVEDASRPSKSCWSRKPANGRTIDQTGP